MVKKFSIELEKPISINEKNSLESEIDVLSGVRDAEFSENGTAKIEFEDSKTSEENIVGKLKDLGYAVKGFSEGSDVPREYEYYVQGMHCASCEVLIEKKLLGFKGIKSVDASTAKGRLIIEQTGHKMLVSELNRIFKEEEYTFSEKPFSVAKDRNKLFNAAILAGIMIFGFLMLNRLGISSLVNIDSSSSLVTFFAFGLLAGASSCAALVGGIVLSMSKQWLSMYSENDSIVQKLKPHLMFNAGRLVSYAVLGGVLGLIGSQLRISQSFTSLLVIGVSLFMILLGMQMLGFRKFQFSTPKFVSRYIADEGNFKGKYMPSVMGALTFFLPCGFTITAQGIALLTGNPIQSALIMFSFALGTAPMLLGIGLSSVKMSSRPNLSWYFSRVAGVLVLFFALFNVNNQLSVLGYSNLGDVKLFQANAKSIDETGLPEIVGGKQIVKIDAYSYGYKPNYIKIRANVPVRWEITDKGTSGCTNAIISKGLFPDQIPLTPGQTSVKEFTPTKAGKYKFSCWMGMVSGTIEVVDSSNVKGSTVNTANQEVVPSGAKGCGCGGGGGSSCGGSN